MLKGYPRTPTVAPGDTLRLHVASDVGTSTFHIDFYRQGSALTYQKSSAVMAAHAVPYGAFDSDWGWPAYDIPIDNTWKPGVYVAFLAANDGRRRRHAVDLTNPTDAASCVLFVVQSKAPGDDACILYKLPLFTYQAYNDLGAPAGSLYTGAGGAVTLRRPGGGVGGHPWDDVFPDVYDPATARQTFAHWDLKFIAWLESNRYRVEYCTDLDIHSDAGLLGKYRLLISVGHDEYWSAEMRNHVEAFVAHGGNIAFFSGNTSWWRVHLKDADTAFACDKSASYPGGVAVDQWYRTRPENAMTGVSYRGAGGWWQGPREPLGYTVQYANHWAFTGTGLTNFSKFGGPSALVGYECDGAELSPSLTPQQFAVASGNDGTPSSFQVLGVAHLGPSWQDQQAGALSTATMGVYTRHGIVFNAATTDWARVLAGGDIVVDRITRNVIDRLKSRAIRIIGPMSGQCVNVAGEGMLATFVADASSLPNQTGLTFAWTATSGVAGAANGPSFTLQMPSPPEPVTITVTIDDGTACPGFGTLTVTPLSTLDFLRLQFMCQVRAFVIGSAVHHGVASGVRDHVPWLVDPLWDPLRGELSHRILDHTAQILAVEKQAKGIAQLLGQMAKLQTKQDERGHGD